MKMARLSSGVDDTERSPPLKRRKIRRGTQSCWECKRRKTRCTFVTPNGSVCDGCRSRRVECISQQFDDAAEGRGRAETVAERLPTLNGGDPTNLDVHIGEDAKQKTAVSVFCCHDMLRLLLTLFDGDIPCGRLSRRSPDGNHTRWLVSSSSRGVAETKRFRCHPILDAPVSTSVLFHGTVCMPYSSLLSKAMPSPREMLQLPSTRSHPVLIAHKLLLLGTFMQGIPKHAVQDLGTLSSSYRSIMSRLVETVNNLVTIDDELVSSLEGIECIMIEEIYYNNAGNLRRAWVTHRRAMTMAQMLGLHRGAAPSNTLLDARDRGRIDPQHMWCRLIISDRYLSLMLGLPQGSLSSPFVSPQALESCILLERMERMESVAGGLILQRNGCDLHDVVKTQEIDKLLQEAAALMPPQWWLAPCITRVVGHDSETLRETIRLMNQCTHYHLLAQLHLPYLLQPSDEPRYDYSKVTAVMASRELLTRFVAFRGSGTVAAYCRGIDLLSFIASTVLSLAHIDACRQKRVRRSDSGNALHLVAHRRMSDRGLLEQTLQCILKIAEDDKDAMACMISDILQHLLAIEEAAAKDDSYSTTISSEPGVSEPQYGDKVTGAGHSLRIHVPYFGTIKIEHSSVSRQAGFEQAVLDETSRSLSVSTSLSHDRQNSFDCYSQKDRNGEREVLELMPGMSVQAAYRIGGDSANADWQRVPSHLDLLGTEEQHGAAALDRNVFDFEHTGVDMATLLVPGLAADVNDWALQGVDTALFDNMIRGAAEPSADPA